jgi:hypothetical protein
MQHCYSGVTGTTVLRATRLYSLASSHKNTQRELPVRWDKLEHGQDGSRQTGAAVREAQQYPSNKNVTLNDDHICLNIQRDAMWIHSQRE